MLIVKLDGVPGEIRTPDPRLRRALLYPAELLGQICCLRQDLLYYRNIKKSTHFLIFFIKRKKREEFSLLIMTIQTRGQVR